MTGVSTPFGTMVIRSKGEKISSAEFSGDLICSGTASAAETECARQLKEYFSRQREHFDIPLLLEGSEFEVAVWNQLLQIPFGKTCSYGEIAAMIGSPGSARAVGMACRRNKLAVLVPCHRVVGVSGKLVGYAFGIERKKLLLSLEKDAKKGFFMGSED